MISEQKVEETVPISEKKVEEKLPDISEKKIEKLLMISEQNIDNPLGSDQEVHKNLVEKVTKKLEFCSACFTGIYPLDIEDIDYDCGLDV